MTCLVKKGKREGWLEKMGPERSSSVGCAELGKNS